MSSNSAQFPLKPTPRRFDSAEAQVLAKKALAAKAIKNEITEALLALPISTPADISKAFSPLARLYLANIVRGMQSPRDAERFRWSQEFRTGIMDAMRAAGRTDDLAASIKALNVDSLIIALKARTKDETLAVIDSTEFRPSFDEDSGGIARGPQPMRVVEPQPISTLRGVLIAADERGGIRKVAKAKSHPE